MKEKWTHKENCWGGVCKNNNKKIKQRRETVATTMGLVKTYEVAFSWPCIKKHGTFSLDLVINLLTPTLPYLFSQHENGCHVWLVAIFLLLLFILHTIQLALKKKKMNGRWLKQFSVYTYEFFKSTLNFEIWKWWYFLCLMARVPAVNRDSHFALTSNARCRK